MSDHDMVTWFILLLYFVNERAKDKTTDVMSAPTVGHLFSANHNIGSAVVPPQEWGFITAAIIFQISFLQYIYIYMN